MSRMTCYRIPRNTSPTRKRGDLRAIEESCKLKILNSQFSISNSLPVRRSPRLRFGLVLPSLLLLLSGCVTPWERSALLGKRDMGISNIQGPTERGLRNLLKKKEEEESLVDADGKLKPIPGTDEYLAAEKLYEDGDYKTAEKSFKKVAKDFKKSDIREDALFMQAEAAYQQKHLADANDVYGGLLKEYPSTRHLDTVTKRLFETARLWLDFPEAANLSEVQQVNYDNFREKLPPEEQPKKSSGPPNHYLNFTDETRPFIDREGNAISALRLIWLNDPTGPLADDALMMTASHYSRKGNYVEADRHYTMLREEYPNSPHVQTAFLLGSHVKLMAYQGPDYDGKSLDDAEQLKESMIRLYPASEDRQRLENELQKIEEAKAAREWGLVEFYDRKRNPRAQAVYCHLILEQFPETSYAARARDRLQKLGPAYANGGKILAAVDDPKKSLWAPPGSAFKPTDPPRYFGVRVGEPKPPDQAEAETPEELTEPQEPVAPPKPPRRLWFGPKDKPEAMDEPESPGEMESTRDGEVASGEESMEKSGSRLGRMFRFSPPRRLTKDEEAQPNADDPDAEAGAATMPEE